MYFLLTKTLYVPPGSILCWESPVAYQAPHRNNWNNLVEAPTYKATLYAYGFRMQGAYSVIKVIL